MHILWIIGLLIIIGFIAYPKLRFKNEVVSKSSETDKKDISVEAISLQWEITRSEQRERKKKSAIKAAKYFVPVYIAIVLFLYWDHFYYMNPQIHGDYISSIIFGIKFFGYVILPGFILYYLINTIYPYKPRRYSLNSESLHIEKGKEKMDYKWNQFDYFFIHPMENSQNNLNFFQVTPYKYKELVNDLHNIRGLIFYLILKPETALSTLTTQVVVLYSRPENQNSVYEFLSQKLSERGGFEAKLAKYYFK